MKVIEKKQSARDEAKIVCLEDLVPADHLLRKIEKAVNFDEIYSMTKQYYCEDNGRPAVDPVMLVKIVLIEHLFGIRSLRQTVKEVQVNVAYRWFLGLAIDAAVPHFATVSYAFCTRFPSEIAREIFGWILEAAVAKKFVKPEEAFIDGTHTKASANKKKSRKEQAAETAKIYDEQLHVAGKRVYLPPFLAAASVERRVDLAGYLAFLPVPVAVVKGGEVFRLPA